MELLRSLNGLLSFLLELAMLAAFVVWGFKVGKTTFTKIMLGIGIPLVTIVLWALYMAPRASMRVIGPWLPIVTLTAFLAGAAALYAAKRPKLAIILAILAIFNVGLAVIWHQY